MDKIIEVFKYLAAITGIFKVNERKRDIKNDVREKRAELTINRLDKRLKKRS